MARSWCSKHWQRARAAGEFRPRSVRGGFCKVDGCGGKHKALGLCRKHYAQFCRGHELSPGRPKYLNDELRFVAKVRVVDGCWLWIGYKKNGGYGEFRLNGRSVQAHRYAWEVVNGPIPPGLVLDHDNPLYGCGNPACCNPRHLDLTTDAVNAQRRRGLGKRNTSGIRGVRRVDGKYQARARRDGREYTKPRRTHKIIAIQDRDILHLEHFGIPRPTADATSADAR